MNTLRRRPKSQKLLELLTGFACILGLAAFLVFYTQ